MGNEGQFPIEITGDASSLVSASQQSGAALNKTASATEGATKVAEKHTAGLHAMHKVFHALNEAVPGLGVVMQAAFSPVGAAISLAVMALQLFREKMQQVNAELDKMAEENAKPLTNRLEAQRESVVKNAVGLAELKAKLEDAARGEMTMTEATARATKEIEDRARLAAEVTASWEKVSLAFLEAEHAAGILSDQQYFDARLKMAADFTAKKRQQEAEDQRQVLLAREAAVKKAEGELPGLHQATSEAEAKRDKTDEAMRSLPSREALEGNVAKANQALSEFEKKLSPETLKKFETVHTQGGLSNKDAYRLVNPLSGNASPEEFKSLFDAWNKNYTDKERVQQYQGALKSSGYNEWEGLGDAAKRAEDARAAGLKEESRKKVAAADAERELERAQNRELDREGFVAKEKRDLPGAWGALRERYGANATENKADTEAVRFSGIADAIKQGKQEEAQLRKEMIEAFDSHKPVTAEMRAALSGLIAHNAKLAAELSSQNARIRALEGTPARVY